MSAVGTNTRDFEMGRDLAIEMLAEAETLDDREGLRRHRDGKAQNNFAQKYFMKVMGDPQLLGGFTSILSVVLRNDHMDLDCLREITLAETQADADEEAFQAFMVGLRGDAPLAEDRTSE